jgi:SNF2 family DNA or RNA helicase
VITLTAVQDLMYDRFEVEKTLVIAPLRVAEDTWSREADKWDHLRSLRISKVLGSAKTRIQALHADADLYVINRENVVWLVRYLKSRKEPWPFDMVVIDELSSFKSSQAQRFKALWKIRPHVKRIVGLTGTPAANSLMDLWAEIGILDAGERLGRFIGRYRETYFRPAFVSPSGVVYKYTPRPGALEAITERISDITISLKASDYLELPDEIDSVIGVELPGKAKEAYRKMERDALLELEDRQITALNAAAVVSKLTQISNGLIYDGDGRASRIHDAKTDALKELIEQADGPVLVFYEFREDAEHLLRQIDGAVMLAGEAEIMQWNAGRIPVLLAHPASVGYGLNLQDGGHIIVWYGLTWSLEQYQQANARLYRQGQQKPVIIHHILAAGTIDEQVMAALRHKDTSQAALLAALKERRDADA